MKMEYAEPKKSTDEQSAIRDFKDLLAWRASTLRRRAHEICNQIPKAGTLALSSPRRRAAISGSANIVEGNGGSSYQENIQYCRQSCGSVDELGDRLTCALDAKYNRQPEYVEKGSTRYFGQQAYLRLHSIRKFQEARRRGFAVKRLPNP